MRNRITEPLKRDYYERIVRVMNENKLYMRNDLTIKDVAAKTSIPITYVSQVLNSFHEKGYHEFVNGYRLEKAKELIQQRSKDPQSNVSDIGLEVGFNNISTYYSYFKSYVGCTPKQYLRRIQNG